jgi:hypothetical protein
MTEICLTPNATLSFNGIPLAAGLRVLWRAREPARREREFWPPKGITFTAQLEGADSAALFQALTPTEPPLRCELGRAYQRCCTPAGWADALDRAAKSSHAKVRELADALRGSRYRASRKRRRAMRRLLRAPTRATT